MSALQSISKGLLPTPSPYLLELRLMNSTVKNPDQDNGPATVSVLKASSEPSKPAPENQTPTISSSSGSNASSPGSNASSSGPNASSSGFDASDHALPVESTHSPAKDPASSLTSDPSRLSQEKADLGEEPAYRCKRPGSLMETLRSSDNESVIHSDIFLEEKPIIILETPKISYELFTDINVIGHLQERIAEDSLICTLTYEESIDEGALSPEAQLLLLGIVRARYKKGKHSAEHSTESVYDLQYRVGLTFPARPRSLWLIYDYLGIDDDDEVHSQERTHQECDQYEEAEAILKGEFDLGWICGEIGKFDLGRICDNIDEWDPKQGLLEEKVKETLALTQTLLGDTLGFKASKLPSGAPSKPDPCSQRKESLG